MRGRAGVYYHREFALFRRYYSMRAVGRDPLLIVSCPRRAYRMCRERTRSCIFFPNDPLLRHSKA